ncbi:MAG TPA: hypothetical protein VM432_08550, partial [Bdellovibrionales bacterium]|nr:hypothetical protein [Bdellovibrionales bacterium]
MKRPLIILPLGPAAWASHQQIVPELLKVWRRLGCGFTIQAAPPIELGAKFIEECANASVLVFPIGVIHYDS